MCLELDTVFPSVSLHPGRFPQSLRGCLPTKESVGLEGGSAWAVGPGIATAGSASTSQIAKHGKALLTPAQTLSRTILETPAQKMASLEGCPTRRPTQLPLLRLPSGKNVLTKLIGRAQKAKGP